MVLNGFHSKWTFNINLIFLIFFLYAPTACSSGPFEVPIKYTEEGTAYINVSIGTPAQELSLKLDLGSEDILVNKPSTDNSDSWSCTEEYSQHMCSWGLYDSRSSLTAEHVLPSPPTWDPTCDFGSETVSIGGVRLYNQTLRQQTPAYYDTSGVKLSNWTTRMGKIGLSPREAINSTDWATYDELTGPRPLSILGGIVDSGILSTASYSIWLNYHNTSVGSILFGGIDTDKFSGQLHALPTREALGSNSCGPQCRNMISIEDVRLEGGDNGFSIHVNDSIGVGSNIEALLQPAEPYSSLSIAGGDFRVHVNVASDGENDAFHTTNCDNVNYNQSLVVYIRGGVSLRIPVSELIHPDGINDHGEARCFIEILPPNAFFAFGQHVNGNVYLGANILRNIYMSFDHRHANSRIFLAAARFGKVSKPELEAKELKNQLIEAPGEAHQVTAEMPQSPRMAHELPPSPGQAQELPSSPLMPQELPGDMPPTQEMAVMDVNNEGQVRETSREVVEGHDAHLKKDN
ncbi:acid protease [Patellaria atrata CBS 101060]|uniref:Acid protease n=1 Tax=Patellaria atrata CBS 101060 TaxID=1346257 RepID=A0A9P4VSK6_9PEZI|nr:acid protease [Patellaria atrata CBS 101060]